MSTEKVTLVPAGLLADVAGAAAEAESELGYALGTLEGLFADIESGISFSKEEMDVISPAIKYLIARSKELAAARKEVYAKASIQVMEIMFAAMSDDDIKDLAAALLNGGEK